MNTLWGEAMNNTSNSTGECLPAEFDQGNVFKLLSFVCGCLIIPIAVFGTLANLISVYIYTRPSMNNFINVLFTGLATFDVALLLAGTPVFSLMPIANYLRPCYDSELLLKIIALFVTVFYPLAMVAQTCSVWTTIFISFERFVAVCLPFRAKSFNSVKRAKYFLSPIFLSSLLYNIARFFEYKISNEGDLGPNLKSSLVYIRLYAHWSYFLLMFFVPFCVLAFFNVATSLTLKKAQRNRLLLSRQQIKERKTAYMMIGVVILFFVCNFLALIVNSLDIIILELCVGNNKLSSDDQIPAFCDKQKPLYFYFLADLSNLLIEMNSSANIFIYLSFSTAFRTHLKRLFWAKTNSAPGSNNGMTAFNMTSTVATGAHGLKKACYKVSYSKIESD